MIWDINRIKNIGIAIGIILVSLIGTSSAVPVEEWNKTYGGASSDAISSIQKTSDGGYIMAGYTTSYGAGSNDVWLIKTDEYGTEHWNKTFGGASADWASSVQQTSDGGYILVGVTESYGNGRYDFWLIKINADGTEQWNKTFGGTSWDNANSVQQTSDGGYILVGDSDVYGSGTNIWLIKTDANGNQLWKKIFGGSWWDRGTSVQQTSDGGYIIAGYTASYGSGVEDVWLIKTDANGNAQWNKIFGGTSRDNANSVQQTSDGGYIIAAFTSSYGSGGGDAWLIKTDGGGNKQWDKLFGGASSDGTSSVQQASDGGYLIAGYTASYGSGNGDAWLIKTYANSTEQWNKTFGGISEDGASSFQQTSDGGYILAGSTKSYGRGQYDAWLVKVSNDTGTPTPIPCETSPSGLNPCDLRLQKGDILLLHALNPLSVTEALLFDGYWSHAGIYNGDGTITESYPANPPSSDLPGVIINPVAESLFWNEDVDDWAVLRVNSLDATQQGNAVIYAKSKADGNHYYNYNFPDKFTESKFYCSQLVWRAYKQQGIELDSNFSAFSLFAKHWQTPLGLLGGIAIKDAVPPDDIYFSPYVIKVEERPRTAFGRWVWRLLSPGKLLVTDPQGRRTGYDTETKSALQEIPDTFYGGLDADPQFITFRGLVDGTWKFQVIGTGEGEYTLLGEAISRDLHTTLAAPGNISEGEIVTYEFSNPGDVEESRLTQIISIDIKPGSDPAPINLESKGITPVAILSSDTFDATLVDPASVRFGTKSATSNQNNNEDVNGDGKLAG